VNQLLEMGQQVSLGRREGSRVKPVAPGLHLEAVTEVGDGGEDIPIVILRAAKPLLGLVLIALEPEGLSRIDDRAGLGLGRQQGNRSHRHEQHGDGEGKRDGSGHQGPRAEVAASQSPCGEHHALGPSP